jgi:hypothetical protein
LTKTEQKYNFMEATQHNNISETSVHFKDDEDDELSVAVVDFLFLASRLSKEKTKSDFGGGGG